MSNDFFADIDRLRLPGVNIETPTPTPANSKDRRRVRGEFLKGPVPLAWLSAASKLPGKTALAVGLALWFEAGRRRSQTVTLTSAILARFGVNRKGKYRGLVSLEQVGLIEVVRVPRRNPVVTILDTSQEQQQTDELRKENQQMKDSRSVKDMERIHGLRWEQLVEQEPELERLLKSAEMAGEDCQTWTDVLRRFSPFTNDVDRLTRTIVSRSPAPASNGTAVWWDRARNQSQFRASGGSHPKGSPFVVSFLRAFLRLFPSLSTSGLRGRARRSGGRP